jgi:hypothetical protein
LLVHFAHSSLRLSDCKEYIVQERHWPFLFIKSAADLLIHAQKLYGWNLQKNVPFPKRNLNINLNINSLFIKWLFFSYSFLR